MLTVRTASGKRQKYNPKKIYRTCIRAGASRQLANEIVDEISSEIYDGIPTRKVLSMVLESLRRHQADALACRYDLKNAIMRMGPAGFAFETYLCQVFERHGYETRLRQHIKGLCVEHEIDLILEKDGKRSMVEVKYHNSPGIYTGLKEAMYTYSRFLDLSEGHEARTCERFDDAWLATNTRSSLEARKYAMCKGIRLLGWKHPRNRGLERMIEGKGLYPVTVLHGLDGKSFDALSKARMMLVTDLAEMAPTRLVELTGMKKSKAEQLVNQAKRVSSDPLLGLDTKG
jgi:hypothetical protein